MEEILDRRFSYHEVTDPITVHTRIPVVMDHDLPPVRMGALLELGTQRSRENRSRCLACYRYTKDPHSEPPRN